MKKILLISTLIALILVPGVSLADENIPGFAKDKGKKIVVEEPLGWDIEVNTTYNVKAIVESLPGMSIVRVKPYKPWYKFFLGMPEEITISIDGFEPNTDLYVYTNGYREETIVTTDENGTFEITKPTDESVQMIIKDRPSTIKISKFGVLGFGDPGEECEEVGVWTASNNTCTLTQDVMDTIAIEDEDITLDGQGIYKVLGDGTGDGVYTDEKNVTIKDVDVIGFARGVVFDDSLINFAVDGSIQNVQSKNNTQGLVIEGVSGTSGIDLTLDSNTTGIQIIDQLDGNPTDGITIRESTISNNGTGLFTTSHVVAEFVQNNFISNTTDMNVSGTVSFDNATDRGNYWSKNTDCAQDAANPDECTNSYLDDNAPWACENAWSTGSPCPTDPSGPTEFPSFTQINAPWSSDIYDSSDEYLLKCASRSAYNLTIGQCGCAITSVVNVLHSYGITHENSGNEITPKTLDDWLDANSGYSTGSLVWNAVDRYVEANTNSRVKFKFGAFRSSGNTDSQIMTELERILGDGLPAITQSDDRTHFFVVYGKEDSRYLVQDPTWYETMYLDQEEPAPHVRNYENKTAGVHSYVPVDQSISLNSMMIILGSPAEILVTDPIGRRLGVDPTTGIRYEEIPDGYYWKESFIDPALIDTVEPEDSVYLYIDDPIEGDYSIDVIGTDEGEYSLGINAYNDNSEPNIERHGGITQEDQIDTYSFVYGLSDNNDNDSVDKISICHIPSGKPLNAHEISIGESAVPAHLKHGDVEGSCDSSEAQQAIADKMEERNLAKPPKIR